ncbi:hypothetical protein G7K_6492-t1 [Saitoella complicata NRRL Y-17804]|uniref:Uncharacterized protein n=1 Tax=Saitoella complicata (strain BCRC 22490 / CBS 7301 / JCM 7358 / NBRC 10748 / NRRL Y-17804) TaxID=698492 RepID=A0A0E9NRD6_SAICN|nr:hypothetical protein G7K_6492-t1 [Saitoella complicata NRRL Y-17804]
MYTYAMQPKQRAAGTGLHGTFVLSKPNQLRYPDPPDMNSPDHRTSDALHTIPRPSPISGNCRYSRTPFELKMGRNNRRYSTTHSAHCSNTPN